jgi:hypothetical protein
MSRNSQRFFFCSFIFAADFVSLLWTFFSALTKVLESLCLIIMKSELDWNRCMQVVMREIADVISQKKKSDSHEQTIEISL